MASYSRAGTRKHSGKSVPVAVRCREFLASEVFMNRREFVVAAAGSVGVLAERAARGDEGAKPKPVIDTNMHVWAQAGMEKYPFPHPYVPEFKEPPHEGTLEMLLADMDTHGCTHAVLVQVIYHGWDNAYVADCVK